MTAAILTFQSSLKYKLGIAGKTPYDCSNEPGPSITLTY